MGRNTGSRYRSESRMPDRMFSKSEVQPAEVPARVTTGRVCAGRVSAGSMSAGRAPAARVAASGVSSSASVLRLHRREETDYRQQYRKDAQRFLKEGNSSSHGLPTPGNPM